MGQTGWQVDLAFKRADCVITLCEFKHTQNPVDLNTAKTTIKKFSLVTLPTKYQVQRVLVSTNGATNQVKNNALFDRIIELNQLIE